MLLTYASTASFSRQRCVIKLCMFGAETVLRVEVRHIVLGWL